MQNEPAEPCQITFRFMCSKTWDELEHVTGTNVVKFCRDCETNVHYCHTDMDALRHAAKGECVALRREEDYVLLGYLEPPETLLVPHSGALHLTSASIDGGTQHEEGEPE